ncbi:MAG: ThiF family adenylyltransferase [Planctomycetes bacterium]|nr:ThiF family adenylyltransferase [Planctomycetota bacterium]
MEPNAPRPRHSRQARFSGIGRDGQLRIAQARVAVVGLGALGSVSAEILARAGIGHLTIIDRDVLEESNLQRQILYSERDVAERLPKAEAARRALLEIDHEINIRALVDDLTPRNIDRVLDNIQVVVDGTDNFITRYLMNDWCVAKNIPWVYGAAVSSAGFAMTCIPGTTPCLRCVFPEPPPPEDSPNCETAGIIASASGMVAMAQAAETLKLVSGNIQSVARGLLHFDPWNGMYKLMRVERDPACPCCARGERPWLRGERGDGTVSLCGRNSIQIGAPESGLALRLEAMAARLPDVARKSAFLVEFTAEDHLITLFADGRAIVAGTSDPALARTLYARYIGA